MAIPRLAHAAQARLHPVRARPRGGAKRPRSVVRWAPRTSPGAHARSAAGIPSFPSRTARHRAAPQPRVPPARRPPSRFRARRPAAPCRAVSRPPSTPDHAASPSPDASPRRPRRPPAGRQCQPEAQQCIVTTRIEQGLEAFAHGRAGSDVAPDRRPETRMQGETLRSIGRARPAHGRSGARRVARGFDR